MKTEQTLIALSILSIFSLGSVFSQPTLTSEYKDEQITKLIEKHKMVDSRDTTPPAALAEKFKADFPKAKDVEWEIGADVYEVEFEIGNVDYKAYYEADGKLLMYLHEIRRKALPQAVKDAALKKYPGYKIDDIKMIHKGTQTIYSFEMEKGDNEIKLNYKEDGTLITK